MKRVLWTKGPWSVFMSTSGHACIGIGEKTGEGITDSRFSLWRGDGPEAMANATLIAAAPELYEALTRAERKLSAYVGLCNGDTELINTVIPMAKAALAKARGETT